MRCSLWDRCDVRGVGESRAKLYSYRKTCTTHKYNQTTRFTLRSNKFIVVQTRRAVVCYPRCQLLPEVEENILGFVEQILLEALSRIPSDHDSI